MKRLAVLRHADAIAGDGTQDFERRLSARGRAQTALIRRELERRSHRFDAVVASPAGRVRETLDGLGMLTGVRFERSLYTASPETWLAVVRALPDTADRALLVGHNPVLQELVAMLARPGPLSDRIAFRYPTAAAALIAFDCDSWAQVGPSLGILEELILPDELPGFRLLRRKLRLHPPR